MLIGWSPLHGLRVWVGLCLTLVLAACGGGGGGSDSGNGFTVHLDRSSFSITVERGGYAAPALVSATLNGKLPDGPVYIGAESDHPDLLTVELSFPDTRTAVASITANSATAAGTYSGNLHFLLCKDAYCDAQYMAPLSVSYQVTVLPGFEITPASLNLAGTSGQSIQGTVSVQLPAGSSDYAIDPSSLPEWLTVSNRTSSGFTLTAGKAPSGNYNAYLRLSTPTGRSAALPVSLQLLAPSGGEHNLILGSTSFDLATFEGASTSAGLSVNPPTWGPDLAVATAYTSGGASDWLSVVPASGGYTLQANAAALPAGVYQASVQITGDAYTWAQNVNVSLTVGPGLTQVAPRSVNIQSETTATGLSGSVPINLASGPARTWQATSDASWLVLDTSTGTTGDSLAWHVDRTQLEAMANRSAATATVSVDAGSPLTPMHFPVTLNKALAAPDYAMPANRLVNQGGTVYLRGSGFAALDNPSARVSVDGLTGVSVTRVNDSELALTWPGAAAGNYTVRISNALGLPTSTTTVQVQAAANVPPTRIAQTGQKTGLIHDVARRALLVLNREAGTVQRYSYASGTWTPSSTSLASLAGFALSPDGTTLVVVTTNGLLVLLDPVTLATQASYQYEAPFYVWAAMDAALPVTNDGKVWLAAGEGWNQLITFDLLSRRFAVAPLNGLSTSFYYGPWGLASGDGERLLLTQTSSLSPQPRTLYLDARDNLLHETPLNDQYGGSFFYDAAYSDNGRDASGRLVLHNTQVYDGQFASIGQAVLPSGIAHTSTLSADGRTLYVMSMPDAFWMQSNAEADRLATVWVFDARAAAPGTLELPLLGSFTLTEQHTCAYTGQYDDPCGRKARMKVSPDGNALFIVGPTAVLAVAVPDSLARAAATGAGSRKAAARTTAPRTRPMRLWGAAATVPQPPHTARSR